MSKQVLVTAIAEKTRLPRKDVAAVLDALPAALVAELDVNTSGGSGRICAGSNRFARMKSRLAPPGCDASAFRPGIRALSCAVTGWRRSGSSRYSSSDGDCWDWTLTAIR